MGHFGDHVKQFLNLTYPNKKFTFVEVNPYKGEKKFFNFLVYLKQKKYIKGPFIYHACDTIIQDKIYLYNNGKII